MKKNRLSVSLIIPHYQNMFSTFYALEIIKEVSKTAINFDVDLMVETVFRDARGSGILFADMMGNETWINRARKQKRPFLILNYYDPKSKDNCIGIDNEKASFEAVDYLVSSGHRRIAIITGKLNAQAGRARLEGYKKALKQNKIISDKGYIVHGDWTKDSGKQALLKLLSLKEPPTALFVSGDEMAIGAMEAAKDKGLKVPEDISLVGFDNIPQADLGGISLTTVQQPFVELAQLGMKYLIQVMQKKIKQPVKILLKNTELIQRASVKILAK